MDSSSGIFGRELQKPTNGSQWAWPMTLRNSDIMMKRGRIQIAGLTVLLVINVDSCWTYGCQCMLLTHRSFAGLSSLLFPLKLGFPSHGSGLQFDIPFVSITKLQSQDFIIVSYWIHILSHVCAPKSNLLVDISLILSGRKK